MEKGFGTGYFWYTGVVYQKSDSLNDRGDVRCRKSWDGLGIGTRRRRLEIKVGKGSKGSVSQDEDREIGGVRTAEDRRRQGKFCKR